jgi:hypothetical protein
MHMAAEREKRVLKYTGPPRGGGKFPRAPTLIGPQFESESLKLSRFFKLVR